MGRIIYWLATFFLLGNLVVRLPVLHNNGLNVPAIVLSFALLLLFFQYKPSLLPSLFFLFGLSFPLYCYQPYTLNNQVFESLIVVLGLVLCLLPSGKETRRRLDCTILFLLASCLLLALLSILLLPLASLGRLFSLWGVIDFSSAALSATPDTPLYPLSAANRLLLFFVVVLMVSVRRDAPALYKNLFRGAAAGGVLAAVTGVFNQYGLIDLSWLRPQFLDPSGVPRLHSVTGNPGWFAQYILGTFPFVLLLLPRKRSFLFCYLILTGVSLLCGLSLLLTASRTSWLLFPIVIPLCFLFLLDFGREVKPAARGTAYTSMARGVLIIALFSLLAGTLVYGFWYRNGAAGEGKGGSRQQYILKRLRHIATPGERARVWRESLVLASESPLFGLGYEAYKWHQKVMMSIPGSRFAGNRKTVNNWDTPHNFFLQLVIGNGLAGLALWLLLLYSILRVFWLNYRISSSLFAGLSLLSLFTLLFYGLTQSIQYIPLIWFFVFLFAGFAMTIVGESCGRHRLRPLLYSSVILLLCSAAVAYLVNIQSWRLARRYQVIRYFNERGPIRYAGFYSRENWGREGVFRWSGPRAEIRLPETGMIGFTLVCNTPGLALDPVVLDVTLNNVPVDHYTFWKTGKVNRTYYVPAIGGGNIENVIVFTPSRTWTPRLAGMGMDTRNLGIAVSEPHLAGTPAIREAGFSRLQVDESKGRLLLFRWTGRSAIIDPAKYGPGEPLLFFLGDRPFLDKKPLIVRFIQDRRELGSVQIAEYGWNEVVLPRDLDRDRPLMFLVSKTWNPRKEGYGSDGRDLGVAIALSPSVPAKR